MRGVDVCWPWRGYINPQTRYGQVTLNRYERPLFGGQRIATVPVLVCSMVHGPRPPGAQVLHSCDTRDCGNPKHLRWGTQAENNREAWERGRQLRGQRHHRARLSDAQARAAIRRVRDGEPVKAVAADVGMDWGTLYKWLRGKGRGAYLTREG